MQLLQLTKCSVVLLASISRLSMTVKADAHACRDIKKTASCFAIKEIYLWNVSLQRFIFFWRCKKIFCISVKIGPVWHQTHTLGLIAPSCIYARITIVFSKAYVSYILLILMLQVSPLSSGLFFIYSYMPCHIIFTCSRSDSNIIILPRRLTTGIFVVFFRHELWQLDSFQKSIEQLWEVAGYRYHFSDYRMPGAVTRYQGTMNWESAHDMNAKKSTK